MQHRLASQRIRFWERTIVRYGIAVVATGVTVLVRHALSGTLGHTNLYITFYPAVMLAATIGGFGPGILATILCALVVDYWLIPPVGLFVMPSFGATVSQCLFLFMGVFMSGVAEMYHRTRRRVAGYERELAVCESEERYRELVQHANSAIIRWRRDGSITFFNEFAQQFFGYSAEEVIGKSAAILVPQTESDGADLSTLLENIVSHPERYVNNINENVLRDGSRVWMAWTNRPILDEAGQVAEILAVGTDITERKRAEQEREITIEFLRLVNESTGTADLVRAAAGFFLEHSGCEAVGIRLQEGDDYPYYEARGFPEEFVKAENSLCTRDDCGCLVRDGEGYPICECMCGNVIRGRFDASKPFFTEHGSFWTNCTTELLATSTEADRQASTRNRCNGEGYESVALIPLHVGDERLGLLQLNDKREGMFSAELVAQWERFGDYLGVALAKFRAEDALQESEERFRAMVDSIPQLAWMAEPDGYIFWYNRRWYEYTGTTPEQMEGWGWQRVHDPEILPRVMERWQASLSTGELFDMEFPLLGADGRFRSFLTRVVPVKDSEGNVVRWFGTNTDVSEARELEDHKREFYRRTIFAATEGKLTMCEPGEIEELAGTLLGTWEIKAVEDVARVRSETTSLAREAGMDELRVYDVTGCVVESAANAVKHAGGGRAALYKQADSLLFVISDSGPGIGAMSLPDVALTKGYSTAGTLGMGYKVMINFADRVYLATGPHGTTVAAELRLHVGPEESRAIPSNLSTW